MSCCIGGRDGTGEAFQGGPGIPLLPSQADYPIFEADMLASRCKHEMDRPRWQ